MERGDQQSSDGKRKQCFGDGDRTFASVAQGRFPGLLLDGTQDFFPRRDRAAASSLRQSLEAAGVSLGSFSSAMEKACGHR